MVYTSASENIARVHTTGMRKREETMMRNDLTLALHSWTFGFWLGALQLGRLI